MGLLKRFISYEMGRKKGSKKSSPAADSGSDDSGSDSGVIDSLKRGGKIRTTGKYELHKGERVLTAKQAKSYRAKRSVKRSSKR